MKKFLFFILLFSIFFIPKNTFAIEKTSLYPDELYLYYLSTDKNTQLTIEQKAANNRWFYGYTFATAQERNMMRFYYNFPDNPIKNQIVDIDFIILHDAKSGYLNPIQVYVQSGEQLTSCSVSTPQKLMLEQWYGMSGNTGSSNDTIDQYESPIGYYSNVSCDEAYIYDNLAVVVGQNYLSQANGFLGVSALGVKTASSQDLSNQIQNNSEAVKEQTEATKEQTEYLKDDDTTEAEGTASDFFSGIESDNHGLSGLITQPLDFLRALTSTSCQPLEFELPFVHDQVSLPCMKGIYQQHFGVFFSLYQMMTTGLIAYSVGIRLFARIKGLQDPQNDRIEVFNL